MTYPLIDSLTEADFDLESHPKVERSGCKIMFYANGQIKFELDLFTFTSVERFKPLTLYKDRMVLVATDDSYGGVAKHHSSNGPNSHVFITLGCQKYFSADTSFDESVGNSDLMSCFGQVFSVEHTDAATGRTVANIVIVFPYKFTEFLETYAVADRRQYKDTPKMVDAIMPRPNTTDAGSETSAEQVITPEAIQNYMSQTPGYLFLSKALSDYEDKVLGRA